MSCRFLFANLELDWKADAGFFFLGSVDFEKQFTAIHRDGLKILNAEMQDPTKSSGARANIKDRALKVHCTSVIDTDATKDIIYEGVFFPSPSPPLFSVSVKTIC